MTWHSKHVKTHPSRSVASWVPAGHAAAVTSNLSSTHMLETCSPWEMWPLGAKKGAVERVDCEVGQKVWHPAKVRKYPFLRVSWMKRWAEGEVGVSLAMVCKTWRVPDYIEHHTHRIHICYIWQHLHLPSIYPQCWRWHIYQHHGSYGS
jgi:hypothetical protein